MKKNITKNNIRNTIQNEIDFLQIESNISCEEIRLNKERIDELKSILNKLGFQEGIKKRVNCKRRFCKSLVSSVFNKEINWLINCGRGASTYEKISILARIYVLYSIMDDFEIERTY